MKKVNIITIVILTIFTLLTGCAQRYSFSVQYIRTNEGTSETKYNSVILINSSQQLQEYYDENSKFFQFTCSRDESISFKDAIKKYDDNFFEKKVLAVIVLAEGSGSIRHRVNSVVKNNDKIAINIRKKSPRLQTDDVAAWHILLDFKKDEIPESAEFSVNVK